MCRCRIVLYTELISVILLKNCEDLSETYIFEKYSFHLDQLIGLVSKVFANGPGDLSSIPGRVIPKTLKNGTWYLLA